MKYFITIWFSILLTIIVNGQNYHAINGSSFAGSLGVHNNPSSIVNTASKWDITLFGTQVKSSTNAVTLHNFSFLHFRDTAEYAFNDGNYSRHLVLNDNVNLFNTRIALNKRSSIAFGANIKNYLWLKTGDYNYIDTIKSPFNFFALNTGSNELSANVAHSAWIELYGSYARTVWDNDIGRLNAGITVKLTRGISGAYGRLSGGRFAATTQNNEPEYAVTGGTLQYGYSSNYDKWKDGNSTSANLNTFLKNSQAGVSFDLGFEYLIKPLQAINIYDEDDYYDYDWKIGVSVLDIGFNRFYYGNQSRFFSGIKSNITSATLENKFDTTINSVKTFNDSMATIVSRTSQPLGRFSILNPARLVINIDRFIYKGFSLNAELSVNVPSTLLKNYLYVQDLNLVTVTPRWETQKWGVYMPIQYNNKNQLWIGGAFKAGPVLLGIHNWGNVFSKSKIQNGGGYLAIIIRSPQNSEKTKMDKRLGCPL